MLCHSVSSRFFGVASPGFIQNATATPRAEYNNYFNSMFYEIAVKVNISDIVRLNFRPHDKAQSLATRGLRSKPQWDPMQTL